MSDGMFLSACRQVSKDFPDVAYDEDLLDRACLQVKRGIIQANVHPLIDNIDRAKPTAVF